MTARVFLLYSQKDEALCQELEGQLDVLTSNGTLTTWHARKLEPGEDARVVIDRELEAADLVLLLVSADFLASEYKEGAEVRRALERHEEGKARVVPVVLRPCLWDEAAFGRLSPLPSAGQPVTLWQNRDEAWLDVVNGLLALIRRESRPRVSEYTPTPSPAGTQRTPTPPARPEVGRWLRELEDAQAQKTAALQRGEDVRASLTKIDELKRRLREGGQLQQNDSLGDGRYFLLRPIGRGGFATVWEADDRLEGKRVAIKVLHPQLAADPVRCERFFRGARAMAKLDHPNIVRVLVPFEEDAGFFYFVMELVSGGDLYRAVRQGRIPRSKVVPLILEVGDALALAHEAGFVHRDVSPHNILLGENGEAKLSDFDLVAAEGSEGGTRTGAMGKFLYTAPEVMARPQDADARADVFGLGMTAIFCWHGADLPTNVLRKPEQLVAKLDCGPLAPVLQKSIEWDADDRYPNARAFCDALRAAANRSQEPAPSERRHESMPAPRAPAQLATFQRSPPSRKQSGAAPWMWGALLLMAASSILAMIVWAKNRRLHAEGPESPALPEGSADLPASLSVPPGAQEQERAPGTSTYATASAPAPSPRRAAPSRAAAKPPRCPKDMVFIDGGIFRIGSEHGDKEATDYERPAHDVELSPFCIDKTEVTVAAYRKYMAAAKIDDKNNMLVTEQENGVDVTNRGNACNASRPGRDDHPINCVSWKMANDYCLSLGRILPTEAQWEAAARGPKGKQRRYPWGDEAPGAGYLNASCCGGARETVSVKDLILRYEKDKTFEGVVGLGGNVREWVLDQATNYEAQSPAPKDPVSRFLEKTELYKHMVRGGGWANMVPRDVRAAIREGVDGPTRSHSIGFRCAITLK